MNLTRLKRFPTTRRGLTVCADASFHRPPAGEDFVLSSRMVLFLDEGIAGSWPSSGQEVPELDPE